MSQILRHFRDGATWDAAGGRALQSQRARRLEQAGSGSSAVSLARRGGNARVTAAPRDAVATAAHRAGPRPRCAAAACGLRGPRDAPARSACRTRARVGCSMPRRTRRARRLHMRTPSLTRAPVAPRRRKRHRRAKGVPALRARRPARAEKAHQRSRGACMAGSSVGRPHCCYARCAQRIRPSACSALGSSAAPRARRLGASRVRAWAGSELSFQRHSSATCEGGFHG